MDTVRRRGTSCRYPGRVRETPFVAEDLGAETPEMQALTGKFGIPGMRIYQFGFYKLSQEDIDKGIKAEDGYHRPRNYPKNTMAASRTHDMGTDKAWLEAEAREGVTAKAGEPGANWILQREIAASQANLAVVGVTDALNLGEEDRINHPDTFPDHPDERNDGQTGFGWLSQARSIRFGVRFKR